MCDKQGARYEDYVKVLSLSEFAALRHSVADTVRSTARREAKSKAEVHVGSERREGREGEVQRLIPSCCNHCQITKYGVFHQKSCSIIPKMCKVHTIMPIMHEGPFTISIDKTYLYVYILLTAYYS